MNGSSQPRRVVLKISGERLCRRCPESFSPFDAASIARIVEDMAGLHGAGYGVVVICGAGNLLRGRDSVFGDRVLADQSGMLATLINSLAVTDALRTAGLPARTYSAVPVGTLVTPYRALDVRRALDEGVIAVVGGGTGAPFVTTDSAAALRALELGAGCILKATQVDGVYSADPRTEPGAERFERLDYDEVLSRRLAVMDLSAVELCRSGGVEVRVFSGEVPGGPLKALTEEGFATVIGPPGAD